MASAPKKFGIVIKHNVPKAAKVACEVAEWLLKKKCEIFVADESAAICKKLSKSTAIPKEEIPTKCDMVLVFGGDGTFLSIARQMIWKSIPILGVNLGQLGFLTEVKVEEIFEALELILKGKHQIKERTMLEACVNRKGKQLFCLPVLNDVVVNKSAIARMVDVNLSLNGVLVSRVRADGIIASTPTGSTAYSLAAGGPIVHPGLDCITVTAICPHSLNMRPLVIPGDATVQVEVLQKDGDIMLTLDGQQGYELHQGDVVSITKFPRHTLKIVQSPNRDYFELLRTKLYLGARG